MRLSRLLIFLLLLLLPCSALADKTITLTFAGDVTLGGEAKLVGEPAELKARNIMDCMECRCCEYICSSKIPLVTLIKIGKNAVRGMK